MTLDHYKALDYLPADQGGICAPATISCCFYVNTSGLIKKRASQLPEKASCRLRQISYGITYTWNLKKQYKWTYLTKRNRVTDVENELMVTSEGGRKGQIGRLGLTYINYYIYIYPTHCNPMNCSPPGSSAHGDSPGKNTWVGCHALLSGSSQPRDLTQVSCTAGGLFMVWAIRELYIKEITNKNLLCSRGNST